MQIDTPFLFENTRPFLPGAMGEAYIPLTLLPLFELRGSGSPILRQLGIFATPLTQMQAAPQAWDGVINGQYVLQPLVNSDGTVSL